MTYGGGNPAALSVAASPRPAPSTPAVSGLRGAFRSWLSFGPAKGTTPATTSPPQGVRQTIVGSVRKSIARDRVGSVSTVSSDDTTQVISIDRYNSDSYSDDDNSVRRSGSMSQIEGTNLETNLAFPAPVLRTPSPGLPLSLDLSTILEADTSAISKHGDTSLSHSDVAKYVLAALDSSPSAGVDWSNPSAPVVIDADDFDRSISIDPSSESLRYTPSQLSRLSTSSAGTPTTPKFSTRSRSISPHGSPRPSPTTPSFPPTSTPAAVRRTLIANAGRIPFTPTASSSLSTASGSKVLNGIGKGTPPLRNLTGRNDTPIYPLSTPALPRIALTTPNAPARSSAVETQAPVRGSLGSHRSQTTSSKLETPRKPSLDTKQRAVAGVRQTSLELRKTPSVGSQASSSRRPLRSSPSPSPTASPSLDPIMPRNSPSSSPLASEEPTRLYRPQSITPRGFTDFTLAHTTSALARKRAQERRLSLEGNNRPSPLTGRHSPASAVVDTRRRSNSATDGREVNPVRPGTSMSAGYGSQTSRLTSRVARSPGLLDRDRDFERDTRSHAGDLLERDRDVRRHRSGSVGVNQGSATALAPSPLRRGGSGSGISRLGSGRPVPEPRAQSRMAFSDVGGAPSSGHHRRGSGSFSPYGNGLLDSPTYTGSSGSREAHTPRSSGNSTAATSISGYTAARERDTEVERYREEMRLMKENHAQALAAVLNALSEGQRTVNMLREENHDLRDRLHRMEGVQQENIKLVRLYEDTRYECVTMSRTNADLRKENRLLKAAASKPRPSSAASLGWPAPATATTYRGHSPLFYDNSMDRQNEEEERIERLAVLSKRSTGSHSSSSVGNKAHLFEDSVLSDNLSISSSPRGSANVSAHSTPRHKRRASTSSSIFPAPPANMTMLLNEDPAHGFHSDSSNRSSGADQFRHSAYSIADLGVPPPPSTAAQHRPSARSVIRLPTKSRLHSHSHSPSDAWTDRMPNGRKLDLNTHRRSHSNFDISYSSFDPANSSGTARGNISPTTTLDFSVTSTGSPGSLYLKPEHEMLLEEMESLDLGAKLEEMQVGLVDDPDAW